MKGDNLKQEIRWLLEEKYEGERTAEAKRDIARLKKGEHVDYLIGRVDFLGCKIDLSRRPLIPRPETEYWVEQAIGELQRYKIQNTRYKIHVLDMFAGSGCIGVAVLKQIPETEVDFVEKEKKFVKQIQINLDLNKIGQKRYRIFESDVFSNVSRKYHFILANPPYIAESKKSKIQASVIENEPSKALFGGKDGLLYTTRFLKDAKKYLKKEGKVYMEFDSFQKGSINNLLKAFEYKAWNFYKDQYENWRYVVISL